MLSKNSFSFFPTSPALFALVAFMLAHKCVIVWGAESLRLGFSGASATQLAGYLAVEQKLFDIYSVNVELTQSAGTTMIRALDSGSLDVAIVGGGQALSAYMKGVDVRIITGLVNIVPFQLWAKPEISQLKDLKGKLIANTPPGTSLNLANQILLSPPDTIEARRSRLRMLMDLATARIPCPFTSVVTTRTVLEKSPTPLDRFLRGILHGIKLALTNPDMAKKTISRNMRLTDPEAVEEVYQRAVAAYERVPTVPKEAIETVVKLSTGQSNRNPFGVLDMTILDRIDKEGFIRSLYAAK